MYLCVHLFSATQRSFHALQPQRSITLLFSVFFLFRFVSFCFCFCFVFVLFLLLFFFLPERIKVLQASPASPHRSISHIVLSLSLFFTVREDENMLHTSLAAQAFRHTVLITTQDYFLTGLFCHRFIRHMGPLYAFFTTQVYFIGKVKISHSSTVTKNYLPHRFVACFKVALNSFQHLYFDGSL